MPYKKAVLKQDVEEERRLFYVGMTRAKESASFLVDDYKISSSFSGVLISLFFLAIMLPRV